MKRVKAACLYQTLVFLLDPNVDYDIATKKVKWEVEAYKEKAKDNVQILDEIHNEDGSVTIKIRKKLSGYEIGDYFD